ncbi:MAG: NUDIX hydrolase [Sphingopyxis sp.]
MTKKQGETAKSGIVWQGRYMTAHCENGWEYVTRPNGIRAAVILPIDDAADGRHVILVEQYRVHIGQRCIEFPAGLVGDDVAGEPASAAAARELAEETGYRADIWVDLGNFYSSPGLVGESFSMMVARNLTKIGAGGGVAGEDIVVHRVPISGIAAFLDGKRAAGCAVDAKLLLLLTHAMLAE